MPTENYTAPTTAYRLEWTLDGARGGDGGDDTTSDGFNGGFGGLGGRAEGEEAVDGGETYSFELGAAGLKGGGGGQSPWYAGGAPSSGLQTAGGQGGGASRVIRDADGVNLLIAEGGGGASGGGGAGTGGSYGGGAGGGGGRGGQGGAGSSSSLDTVPAGQDGGGSGDGGAGGDSVVNATGVSGGGGGAAVHSDIANPTTVTGGSITSGDAQVNVTALLFPDDLSDLSIDAVTNDTIDLSWSYTSLDEAGVRVLVSTDGGSTYTTAQDLAPGTKTTTLTGLRDGEEYVVDVELYATGTGATSTRTPNGPVTTTTPLPDLTVDDITPIDASVEDQLTVPEPGVTDYGDIRAQLRVTGSGNAFGDDVVVAHGGGPLTFATLLDGEKYDLRVRTETEHVDGAWVGVSAITLLPKPGSVQVVSIQAAQATVTWTDTADNEDDILVERRREYADGWGTWQTIATKAAGSTQHVDDTVVPGTTIQFRVSNRTEHVVSRATTAETTADSVRPSDAAPTSGWYAEIDTPNGTRTPSIVGTPQRDPSVNDLERVTIPVPKDEAWDSEAFTDAPVRVWHDGERLPVDTLIERRQTAGRTELVCEGGTVLHETGVYPFRNTDVHSAFETVTNDTPYGVDVTSPSVSEEELITIDSETGARTYLDTARSDAPVLIRNDGTVETAQTCFVFEGENWTSGTTYASGDFGDGADYSLDLAADAVDGTISKTITLEHEIPGDELGIKIRGKLESFEGELQVRIDGETAGADLVANSTSGALSWANYEGGRTYENDSTGQDVSVPTLGPGDHTVAVEAINPINSGIALSGNWLADVVSVYDKRHPPSGFDNTTDADSALATPERYPANGVGAVFLVRGYRSGDGARVASTWDDTTGAQAVALSDDYGATYVQDTNSANVSATFGGPYVDLLFRATLGAYGTQTGATPTTGINGQSMSEFTLFKDVRDSPPIIAQTYRGQRRTILTQLVERGDMLWALDWDRENDQQTIQMANVGDRESDRDLDLVSYEWSTQSLGRQYESATVKGAALEVADEGVTADILNDNSLDKDNLVDGSETVRDANTGTVYERGPDYDINYETGVLFYPAGSTRITDGAGLAVTYEWKPIASYAKPGASPKKALDDVEVAATTDAMCESLAFYLVDRLGDGPVESGTITIPSLPAGYSVLDALALDGLPNDEQWTPRGLSVQDGRVTMEVASRRRVQDVVSDLQSRLSDHGEHI